MKSDSHLILRVITKGLVPMILIYGFYIQFHGDVRTGGAFQAGMVIAAALILHALVFGLAETMRAVPPWFVQALAALGLLIYAGTGVWGIVSGGAYLDFQTLLGEPPGGHDGQHLGILLVELGVLLAVSGSMLSIFYALAGRVAEIRDEGW